jgi:hypothetical protein
MNMPVSGGSTLTKEKARFNHTGLFYDWKTLRQIPPDLPLPVT